MRQFFRTFESDVGDTESPAAAERQEFWEGILVTNSKDLKQIGALMIGMLDKQDSIKIYVQDVSAQVFQN